LLLGESDNEVRARVEGSDEGLRSDILSKSFCVWSEENYMIEARYVVFDDTWCLGLGGTEGQVITLF
jgi:hypothetical protein